MAIAKSLSSLVVCTALFGGAYYFTSYSGSPVLPKTSAPASSSQPSLEVRRNPAPRIRHDAPQINGVEQSNSSIIHKEASTFKAKDLAHIESSKRSTEDGRSDENIYSPQMITQSYIASLPTPPDSIDWGSPEHIAWSRKAGSLSYLGQITKLKKVAGTSAAASSDTGDNPYKKLLDSGGIFDLIDSETAPNATSEEELIDAHRAVQAQSYLDKVSQLR